MFLSSHKKFSNNFIEQKKQDEIFRNPSKIKLGHMTQSQIIGEMPKFFRKIEIQNEKQNYSHIETSCKYPTKIGIVPGSTQNYQTISKKNIHNNEQLNSKHEQFSVKNYEQLTSNAYFKVESSNFMQLNNQSNKIISKYHLRQQNHNQLKNPHQMKQQQKDQMNQIKSIVWNWLNKYKQQIEEIKKNQSILSNKIQTKLDNLEQKYSQYTQIKNIKQYYSQNKEETIDIKSQLLQVNKKVTSILNLNNKYEDFINVELNKVKNSLQNDIKLQIIKLHQQCKNLQQTKVNKNTQNYSANILQSSKFCQNATQLTYIEKIKIKKTQQLNYTLSFSNLQNSSNEILYPKSHQYQLSTSTYLIDQQGYLLSNDQYYLMDTNNCALKLSIDNIQQLKDLKILK